MPLTTRRSRAGGGQTARDVAIQEAVAICRLTAEQAHRLNEPIVALTATRLAEWIALLPRSPRERCGTRARYQEGCRCPDCKAAKSIANAAYRDAKRRPKRS